MINAIPNPTKSITVNFPINVIRNATKNIDKVMQFCHFREGNDTFNYYKFSRNEFLSMGAFINISLSEVSNTQTKIDIEIARKVGAFDEWVEVQKAGKHIDETINAISYIIKNGVPVQKQQSSQPQSAGDTIATIVGLVIGIVGVLWIMKLMNS